MIINRKIVVTLISAVAVIGIFAGVRMTQESAEQYIPNNDVLVRSGKSGELSQTTSLPTLPAPSVISAAPTTTSPLASATQDPNEISAKAYLVGDTATGKIYIERNDAAALPVASVSKLITALVANMSFSSTTRITITKDEAALPPDGSNISAGETYSVSELMYPLLLDSSNIAAEALASSSNKLNFLELMSSYAWEVGMPDTFFADSSGLSMYNQASAKDIFTLSQYLYKYRPDILTLTRTRVMAVGTTTDHGSHIFASIHPFVDDPRFIGGKTGRTVSAGETMLTVLNINNHPISFIVLGSDLGARERDTRLLIDKVQGLIN